MVSEQALAQSARQAGLRLLVLFGSRVLGQVHGQSGWDFGYLASGTLDEESLRERLIGILGTDLVDLVDLSKGRPATLPASRAPAPALLLLDRRLGPSQPRAHDFHPLRWIQLGELDQGPVSGSQAS